MRQIIDHRHRTASSPKLALTAALLLLLASVVVPSRHTANANPLDTITLTAPNNVTIGESDDYATQALGDAWDMNNVEDIDFPANYTVPQVANGVWSATTTSTSGAYALLQYQNFSNSYSYLGEKDGVNYPISTSRFTHLMMRVNVSIAGSGVIDWYRAHAGAPSGNSNFVDYQTGWHIYNVDLTAQGGGANGNWLAEGNVAGFRVDAPWFKNGDNVHYDWARLTPANGNPVQITWNYSSGAPSQLVNLYLSASPDPNQDNEYQIAANVPASNRSYTWMGTGMAPGTYYIHANLNGAVSSSGPLNVNAAPVARIDAPSQFSGEDYAQAKLSAAWNGSNSTQFERTVNINPIQWTPSYLQTSATNNDPQVWWLDRDSTHAIDTSRYRYMSIRMWLQTPSSSPTSVFNAGPRMTWSQTANSDMQQTFLSFAPYNRWIPLSYDLPNAPLVLGTQGWTGYESTLRFDPHESDDQSGGRLPDFFRMDQSHLTSRSISGPSTLIRWSALQGNGSVDLFYDTDNSGYNGTQVASSVPLYNGSYAWNTSAVPNGVYYVYMIAHDSYNSSRVYSLVPLVVDHASPSTIFTDVPTNYWAVTYVNNMATRSIVSGYGQTDTSVMFRPGSSTTAGQLSKMITNSFGFAIDTSGGPHFSDVPTTQPFYPYIETLYNRGIVSGYADGTFRPGRGATRGQIAKMIALSGSQAYGWSLQNPATNTFADVPVGSTYFTYIETVYRHNQIISGYACGGPGEPCDGQQRPYFRPANSVTRAQLSKMLSNAIGAP